MEKNIESAYNCYFSAASSGIPEALKRIAELIRGNNGTMEKQKKGFQLLEEWAKSGKTDSGHSAEVAKLGLDLIYLYGTNPIFRDFEKGKSLLFELAEDGYGPANVEAGRFLFNHHAERDSEKYFQKAKELREKRADVYLAYLREKGPRKKRNLREAFELYKSAIKNKDKGWTEQEAEMAKDGYGRTNIFTFCKPNNVAMAVFLFALCASYCLFFAFFAQRIPYFVLPLPIFLLMLVMFFIFRRNKKASGYGNVYSAAVCNSFFALWLFLVSLVNWLYPLLVRLENFHLSWIDFLFPSSLTPVWIFSLPFPIIFFFKGKRTSKSVGALAGALFGWSASFVMMCEISIHTSLFAHSSGWSSFFQIYVPWYLLFLLFFFACYALSSYGTRWSDLIEEGTIKGKKHRKN